MPESYFFHVFVQKVLMLEFTSVRILASHFAKCEANLCT